MTLWIVLFLMTAFAALIIIVPMIRSGNRATARDSYSLEVYRDQLQELDADAERGLLSQDEAKAARLEVERRMLALTTGEVATDLPKTAAARSLPVAAMIALAMGAASFFLYSQLGTPGVPGQPFAQRTIQPGDGQPGDLRTAIERLVKRLENEPNNIEGWTLLGQSYSSLHDYDNAANAFQQALKLNPDDTDLLMNFGESLVLSADNQVIPAARDAFRKALEINPHHMGSRFYLAEYEAQNNNLKAAMDGWLKLVSESPADAPWMPALMQRLEKAATELKIDLASVLPKPLPPTGNNQVDGAESEEASGPTQEEMAAAGNMTAEERSEMIRSMVERLAARLEDEPDDFEGWQRLARAYGVLGEKEKAQEAWARMVELRPGDINVLMQQASAIIESSDRGKPLPDEAVSIFTRVLELEPENQDALYFTGLAASQRKAFEIARARWTKLLTLLPRDGRAWQAVNNQLSNLP